MTDLEREIADRFVRDTADHTLTVLHDDGLYRHLRCAKPDSSFYWFEIITWPGSLVFRGDMDCAPVFSRVADMFAFFRSDSGRINPGYWAEKLPDAGRSTQKYSEDMLREHIEGCLKEYAEEYPQHKSDYVTAKHQFDTADWADRWPMKSSGPREPYEPKTPAEIRQLVEDYDSDGMLSHSDGARDLLRDLEKAGVCSDTWEWDLTDWDWPFLWACHAIVWAIRQYDKQRPAEANGVETVEVAAR
ncbi:hypothetical protein ACQEVC_45665 [Plantactinospora sp. CA-294935]|uniref:hypothetical protein n=1 Tax=Plantactinospora sp. CA-294935 TaxID=3240012 RepID=UPI003D8B44DC